MCDAISLSDSWISQQAVKVLRTAEFVPYVVFIGAPDFQTLKTNNQTAVHAGLTAKQLSVSVILIICYWIRECT